jgi:hypothetical protein
MKAIARALLVIILVVMSATFITAAFAQSVMVCFSNAKESEATMAKTLGQFPVGEGITSQGDLLKLYLGDTAWTIAIIKPNGMWCPIREGDSWQDDKPPTPGEGL